jgi:hypothetical protein
VRPDEKGNYKLASPSTGWYQVMIEWRSDRLCEIGGFRKAEPFFVDCVPIKAEPGKTFFLATTKPFYFTGQEDLVRNLPFRKD